MKKKDFLLRGAPVLAIIGLLFAFTAIGTQLFWAMILLGFLSFLSFLLAFIGAILFFQGQFKDARKQEHKQLSSADQSPVE